MAVLAALFFPTLYAAVDPAVSETNQPTVLFLVGEVEYGTRKSLPDFAQNHLTPLGLNYEFIFASSGDRDSTDCHEFPGLAAALQRADLLFVSTRRRFPDTTQMRLLQEWSDQKKPIVGIRTASHAFGRRSGPGYIPGHDQQSWDSFDRDVFGVRYDGHYGNEEGETVIRRIREAANHSIMREIAWTEDQVVSSSLYQNLDLDPRAQILFSGHLAGRPDTYQPVSWSLEREGHRTFYTSLGDPNHFQLPWFQRHLAQAITWALQNPSPDIARDLEFLEKDYEATGAGQSPSASLAGMRVPADLTVDLLAAEPGIEQPVFLNFDERGRMWVVEYRQYPEPAGLKLVSRDQYWRNVYDQKPAPPGHPDFIPGLDRISIHEDTDGDGSFDQSKIFADGLSFATSCVTGDGGVWVLNPPYLLFYPDADGDDVPDAEPIVHLDGFGIQDSHALVNSLCWGPDGWLYAAQGSTVTSDVVVTGRDDPPVSRVGQLMWRYHPELRQYEVFAEGGGNVWSCEFDAQGRLLAGTNDRFPGYYFHQGAYYRKNFGKHGALSNPHAYDYFDGINAPGHRRISNSILRYEEGALPERYNEALLYLGVLQGKVGSYELAPEALNFHGTAIDLLLDAQDRWFRPVYLETGPDGALYLCDWYDQQVNHYRNHEGDISKLDGRLFRIRAENARPLAPIDLSQIETGELVDLLNYRGRWWREMARQQLRWRPDRSSVVPRLQQILTDDAGQFALEALWALNLLGAIDEDAFATAMAHPNPHVRRWAIRLRADHGTIPAPDLARITAALQSESNLEVISQAASSAGRLPIREAREIFSLLINHELAQNNPDLERLIWWSLEPFYAEHPDEFLHLFKDSTAKPPLPDLVRFAMRRMASAGEIDDLHRCADLLQASSDPAWHRSLMGGFEEAYQGRSMAGLPPALIQALREMSEPPLSLLVRLNPGENLEVALAALQDSNRSSSTKLQILEVLAENRIDAALPVLVGMLDTADKTLRQHLFGALQIYDDPSIATAVMEIWEDLDGQNRDAAEALLISRQAWALTWLTAAASRPREARRFISPNAREHLRRYGNTSIDQTLEAIFGTTTQNTDARLQAEVQRVQTVLTGDGGDPVLGHATYLQRCAACHTMFNQGGQVGPDLTSYQRDDIDSLLLAIIHPNAEIRSGFEMTTITTTDGRSLVGFLSRNETSLVGIRTIGGLETILDRTHIESLEVQPDSLMPAGLLTGLEDSELRNLFSFLKIPQPLDIRP